MRLAAAGGKPDPPRIPAHKDTRRVVGGQWLVLGGRWSHFRLAPSGQPKWMGAI